MMQIHEDVFPEPQAWWVPWLLGACSLRIGGTQQTNSTGFRSLDVALLAHGDSVCIAAGGWNSPS